MSPRGPRVAHVQAPAWPHPWLQDLLTRLPGHGWEPLAVTLAAEGPLHRSFRAAGVPSLALDSAHRRQYVWAAIRLARAIRDVDVVHAHLFDAAFVSTVAGAIARKPVVITRHEGPALVRRAAGGGFNRNLYYLLDRLVLVRAAAVIAPSTAVREEVVALGAGRSRVHKILLGADMQRLGAADRARAEALRREFAARSRFVGLTVGRLSWEKSIDVVLHAWKKVLTEHDDAVLLIAGDGPERDKLERLARDLGIARAVSFVGWRADVPELMIAADVVAHASAVESTGLVLLEALALARPLVTTPVGIAGEYLVDGAHCDVVPHGDAAALARALLRVARDPAAAAAMAEAGREAVARGSSIGPMAAAYASVYDELTDTRRHRPPRSRRWFARPRQDLRA